jgi:hypothetical protein
MIPNATIQDGNSRRHESFNAQSSGWCWIFSLRECPYSPQWSSWGLQSSSRIKYLRKHMMPANGQCRCQGRHLVLLLSLMLLGRFLHIDVSCRSSSEVFFVLPETYRMMNRAEIVCRRRNLNCLHVHVLFIMFDSIVKSRTVWLP